MKKWNREQRELAAAIIGNPELIKKAVLAIDVMPAVLVDELRDFIAELAIKADQEQDAKKALMQVPIRKGSTIADLCHAVLCVESADEEQQKLFLWDCEQKVNDFLMKHFRKKG